MITTTQRRLQPAFFAAAAAFLLAADGGAQDSGKKPFSAERSWEIQRLGPPTIAPDGSAAVAAVTRYDMKENEGLADLWLWTTDGKEARRLTTHTASESSPLFSPDGKHIAFVAQREKDKAPQLWVIPVAGGEATRVTSVPTGVSQPMWFPDGKRLAFLTRVWPDLDAFDKQEKRLKEREDAKVKAQIWDGSPVRAWDTWVDDRELHVYAVPVEGGAPEPLTLGTGLQLPRNAVPLESPLYDLSPDGKELAFVADSDAAQNSTNNDVYTLEIGAKAAQNRTADNPAADGVPSYSPDGTLLAFARQQVKGFYGDRRRLMVLDRKTGAIRAITEGWDRSADGLVWDRDSKRLFGSIDDAGCVRVFEIPLDGSPRPVTKDSSFGSVRVADDGTMVALRESFIEPGTLVRVDRQSGEATKLSSVNDALLQGTDFGTYESVTYAGARGDAIQMWVSYPPRFDKSKKHPLYLLIHGGPHNGITNGMAFRWNAQVFNSWGYVTAWPNFHGSSGFGNAFADSINPQQDELPYEDVIKAADWFAQQPWIDPAKLSAGGGSYGGYLTSIVLGRKHPFKALVAHAAVYNWYTQAAADYGVEVRRYGGMWLPEQEKVFRAGSPHFGAANFETPTLVVHGARDFRVPINHGLELYQTLIQRGVPARFLYFPDENHWVLKPQNSILWYSEVRKWLDQHVLGIKPVAPDKGD
jgi:dipeptidyl aminopeptidase/acylaminoacyl peptidase